METVKILGVRVNNATKEEALEFIVRGLKNGSKKLSIFTPNPEIIAHANTDESFKKIVNTADLALADGVGVMLAGKLLGKPFKERITGVDFMLELCKRAAKEGFTVGIMGGGLKIAERTAECLRQKFTKLRIVYVGSEWSEDGFILRDESGIRNPIRQAQGKQESGSKKNKKNRNSLFMIHNSIDILFVALGFPKQERWIYENLPKIPVRVAMTVGGSFDYISGAIPRAPLFIRMLGFEWFFRLIVEPWRWRRQRALIQFLILVMKERIFPVDKMSMHSG